MRRVMLTHKDYPENFNKLAKYIGKIWFNKMSLEQSRQQLALWLGYNSIFELEKSFVKTIPGLINIDELMFSIKEKMSQDYKNILKEKGYGFHYIYDTWTNFESNFFAKIPFYLIESLDKSKQQNFFGVYDKVAKRYPLFIQDYRFGGYYGLFVPYADSISDIEGTIGSDKTMQLHGFLCEYECFPFGTGNSHISVLTEIQEKVSKYFDEEGNWKIEIYDPNIEWDEDEEPKPLLYFEVWNIILDWFNKNIGSWYIIDTIKNEHWLFKELDRAVKELKDNNFKKVEKIIEIEKPLNEQINSKVPMNYLFDEMHSVPNDELIKFHNELQNNPRLNLHINMVDNKEETMHEDLNGEIIKDGDKLFKDGNYYMVEKNSKTNEFYIYNQNNLNEIYKLNEVSTKDLLIVPKGTFILHQDFKNLGEGTPVGLTILKTIQTAAEI